MDTSPVRHTFLKFAAPNSWRLWTYDAQVWRPTYSSDWYYCREIWTTTMVNASLISRLSHAVDLIEKRSQQNRPWKVVTVRRGFDEDGMRR